MNRGAEASKAGTRPANKRLKGAVFWGTVVAASFVFGYGIAELLAPPPGGLPYIPLSWSVAGGAVLVVLEALAMFVEHSHRKENAPKDERR